MDKQFETRTIHITVQGDLDEALEEIRLTASKNLGKNVRTPEVIRGLLYRIIEDSTNPQLVSMVANAPKFKRRTPKNQMELEMEAQGLSKADVAKILKLIRESGGIKQE